MAPTEILARQHYETLAALFEPASGCGWALLTGSTPRQGSAVPSWQGWPTVPLTWCIGTHALLTEDVQYAASGAGHHRRAAPLRRGPAGRPVRKGGRRPTCWCMSATPIPRTLALIIYGDLDVSIIDELPPGRQKVDTFAVGESYRQRLNGFIRKQVAEGHQVFIVCPLVEEDDQRPR